MPELPEVEVSRMGTAPHLEGQEIKAIDVRQPKLRWPIPSALQTLSGQTILSVTRRAKYLLLSLSSGTILIHLGMSGSLRVLDTNPTPGKHDHVDLVLANGKRLRYNDPRRFGCWLYYPVNQNIDLLDKLGPEPLTDDFNSAYLWPMAQRRKISVKQFVMNNSIVVGVGNIYANEALFSAKIYPFSQANELSIEQWAKLVTEIKKVLINAITQGGTTLNDFKQPDGKPGYFAQTLNVYGREGKPCVVCSTPICAKAISGRNTFWCDKCQH